MLLGSALLRGCVAVPPPPPKKKTKKRKEEEEEGEFFFVAVVRWPPATARPPLLDHSHNDERDLRAASARCRNLALEGGRSEPSGSHNDVAATHAIISQTPTRAIISQIAD